MNNNFDDLLRDYPKYMSKEQMRIVCHISKRKALFLLQSGLVPYISNGKKTRTYKIAKVDVAEFMRKRSEEPETFRQLTNPQNRNRRNSDEVIELLGGYDDVLNVQQVAEICGVAESTIVKHVSKKQLFGFKYKYNMMIPKLSLIEYVLASS